MDKVKQYLELARKHHFWVLCAISAVAGVVAWYLASGKLSAQFKQDSQTIDGTFSSLKNVAPDQPHDDWAEGYKKKTAAVSQDVLNAWKALYQEQKGKVFVWPKELSQDFLDAANQLSDPNAYIPRKLREYYQSMVKQQVGTLAKIVDAASLEDSTAGNTDNDEHRVDWSQTSQRQIEESFDWTERPTTLLIKYAQEELWVYQALCNVIKAANDGSTGRHDAIVQEIISLEIAYDAVEETPGGAGQNRVEAISGTSNSGGAPSGPPTAGAGTANTRPDPKTRGKSQGGGRGFAFGPGSGDAAAAPTNPDDLWKSYRYVNLDGTPKTAAEVDAGGGEFNLMPFRLLVRMDSRYVDRLLVAFRNSVLPFEVQQVRINPEHTTASSSSSSGRFSRPGAAAGPPMGPGMGPEGPGMGSRPGRFNAPAATGTPAQHERLVTVEVRGVAYLLKPPDPQKLHIAPAEPAPTNAASAAGAVEASAVEGVIKQVGDNSVAPPANNPAPAPVGGPGAEAPAPDSATPAAVTPPASAPAGNETAPPVTAPAEPATPGG